MAEISISFTDLKGEVALALDWNRTVGSWSAAEAADFARINKRALAQAYFPPPLPGERMGWVWSYLRPIASLQLYAPYAEGTVSSASTTVTLTGGTWPTWAASADLWVDGQRLTVATRTNGTTIVLDNAPTSALSGESYQLIQHYYDLASDFGGMDSNAFTFRRDQNGCGEIAIVHEGDVRRSDREGSAGTPRRAAIVPVAPTSTATQRWQAVFDPAPDADMVLEYRYAASPPLLDGSSHVYHYGGAPYSNLFIASYVDVAFQMIRDSDEKHGAFLEALQQAVRYDQANHGVHTMGRGPLSLGPIGDSYGNYLMRRRETVRSSGFDSLVS